MTISLFDRIENTVGKGENAGYQHFLLFLQCFPKPSPLGSLKVGIVRQRVIDIPIKVRANNCIGNNMSRHNVFIKANELTNG